MRAATQNPVSRVINLLLFMAQNLNPEVLRYLYRIRGDRMRVFGGEAFAGFYAARTLMAEENEKIDWIWGPITDRADYLTKSYMPFLLAGPNHSHRRQRILELVEKAHSHLGDLELLLRGEKDHERALTRFMYRQLGQLELTPAEVDGHLDFREWGRRLLLMPKFLRTTVLRRHHDRIRGFRSVMLRRLEKTGEPFSDSLFDAIWFNAGTLGAYPENAVQELRQRRDLQEMIRAEVDLVPGQRVKTRALINEMLRIHVRIASTNYVRHGRDVEVAVIPTAAVDPLRYSNPMDIDLARDHSDAVAFSGSARTRGCPGEKFAPDAMACVLAHRIRGGALD